MMSLTAQQVISYLNENLHLEEKLESETTLFSSGLLDSVMMMNLIMFVEEKQGKQVNPADVTLDNFDTPSRIVSFIESLQ
jgi:acyl carrier protein